MDLLYFVQDFVEVRQLVPVIFGRRLFLILPRAFESGVDCRAHRVVILDSALFFVMARFPVSISEFGCSRVAGAASCQPAILSCAKAGHEACQCGHCSWLFLVEVSGEPFVSDTMFESC